MRRSNGKTGRSRATALCSADRCALRRPRFFFRQDPRPARARLRLAPRAARRTSSVSAPQPCRAAGRSSCRNEDAVRTERRTADRACLRSSEPPAGRRGSVRSAPESEPAPRAHRRRDQAPASAREPAPGRREASAERCEDEGAHHSPHRTSGGPRCSCRRSNRSRRRQSDTTPHLCVNPRITTGLGLRARCRRRRAGRCQDRGSSPRNR